MREAPPFGRGAPRRSPVALAAMLAAVALAVWLTGPVIGQALAQSGGAAPEQASSATGEASGGPAMGGGVPSVGELLLTSPYVNGVLAALSVLAVVLFLYLLITMSGKAFTPPQFVDDVTKLILNGEFDRAQNLCQNNRDVFASSIIQRLIENRDKDHAVLMEMLAAEGRRRAERVWNRVGYLAEISNIAPMIGLLGTVIGMIKVFFTLTTRTAGQSAEQLGSGIAEAMGTTMFGLTVAIAAGLFYTVVKGRATAALTEAEQVCHTIADHTHRAAAR